MLLDGRGIADIASSAPAHHRGMPRWPSSFSATGWAAVRDMLGGSRSLDVVIPGSPTATHELADMVAGLMEHAQYSYDLDPLSGAMLIEIINNMN